MLQDTDLDELWQRVFALWLRQILEDNVRRKTSHKVIFSTGRLASSDISVALASKLVTPTSESDTIDALYLVWYWAIFAMFLISPGEALPVRISLIRAFRPHYCSRMVFVELIGFIVFTKLICSQR